MIVICLAKVTGLYGSGLLIPVMFTTIVSFIIMPGVLTRLAKSRYISYGMLPLAIETPWAFVAYCIYLYVNSGGAISLLHPIMLLQNMQYAILAVFPIAFGTFMFVGPVAAWQLQISGKRISDDTIATDNDGAWPPQPLTEPTQPDADE